MPEGTIGININGGGSNEHGKNVIEVSAAIQALLATAHETHAEQKTIQKALHAFEVVSPKSSVDYTTISNCNVSMGQTPSGLFVPNNVLDDDDPLRQP